ncbi:MAG TPA: YbjN domain-containing protein [Chloroflexota bacterium]
MSEIQPLSPEMIRRYLDEDEAEYDVDEDDNFVFEYDHDEECDCELTVWLSIDEGDTYALEVANEKSFPRSEWDRFLEICNEWNRNERYPIAYLDTDDETPDQIEIRLDYYVYLPSGATQKQISDLTEEFIENSFDFWKWAHREHGL